MSRKARKQRLGQFPGSDDRELGYEVAKTTAGGAADLLVIPGAGYAVQRIIEAAIGSPLKRRQEDWFRRLGAGLEDLQDRFDDFDPAKLGENEEFVSAVFEATQMAMRTHRDEKREALLNFVLNTARGLSIDEVLRDTFVGYIDTLSGLHVRVLRLLSAPEKSPEMAAAAKNAFITGTTYRLLRAAVPAKEVTDEVLDRVLRDLEGAGLIKGSLKTMVSGQALLAKNTTPVGDDFLRFVSSPLGKAPGEGD